VLAATASAPENVSKLGNPYQDPDMRAVLSRKYQIALLNWTADIVPGVDLTNAPLDLMKLLMEVPNIAEKLTQFRFLRADIDVEIRVNATPFHIGALLVSYLPRCTSTSQLYVDKQATLAQKSQNMGTILSASTLNNVTIKIDREATTVMDYIDPMTTYPGALGQLDFTVLNQLSLASNTSVNPVTVSVFASFRDPQPSGFGYFPLSAMALRKRVANAVRKQSLDTPANEAMQKISSGSISAGLGAAKNFAPFLKSSPIGGVVEPIVSALAQFIPDLALSKPTSSAVTQPVQIDDFRDINYTHGTFNGTKFSFRPEAGLGDPIVNRLKKHKISEVIAHPSFIRTVVINKDTPVDTPILQGPIGPTLVAKQGTSITPTHLAYVSRTFRWWRGSMKFLFKFVTSQFVTARVRITHWPSSQLPSSIEEYAGDAVSVIVDVRGDTDYEVTFPYMSPKPYLPVMGYYNIDDAVQTAVPQVGWQTYPSESLTSFFTVSLINPMAQPEFGGPAAIYMNVFTGAGEDMELGGVRQYQEQRPLWQVAPAAKKQSLEAAFSKPFKSIIPAFSSMERGLVLPEHVSTIEEMTKWFRSVATVPSDGTIPWNIVTGQTDYLAIFARLFRWWRGSIRCMFYTTAEAVVGSDERFYSLYLKDNVGEYFPDVPAISFQYVFDRNQRGCASVEIPWNANTYCTSYYDSGLGYDDVDIPWVLQTSEGSGPPDADKFVVLRASGDDFMYGHLLATVGETYVPSPPLIPVNRNEKKTNVDQTLGDSLSTSSLQKFMSPGK
jgi:hypothetical protein